MSGFEEIGIAGPDHLREALTNCTDPLQAIQDFQNDNGILLPTLQPALPLLDLHDIRRLEFHHTIMEELEKKLIERTNEIASSSEKDRFKKIEDLLTKCFPLVRVKTIQPTVMAIMKRLPKIPEKYLNTILEDRELYNATPIEVKRQIWERNPTLFGDEVSPLLNNYVKEKEAILFGRDSINSHMFFSIPPKMRRQSKHVRDLSHMVGTSLKLYDMVIRFLKTLFVRSRNAHYCTLRAEILMSLHDAEVSEICSQDPCHKFTWCLDACIRDKLVEDKKARELQGFLDSVKRGREGVLGDFSMILFDPFAIHTLATSIIKLMSHQVSSEKLPRQSSELLLLLRMLVLGLGAWDMLDTQHYKETKLDNDIILKFLPCLMSLLVDDHIRNISKKLNESTEFPHSKDIPAFLLKTIRKNKTAATLTLYYVLHVTRQRNKDALSRVLPKVVRTEGDLTWDDTFLHPFTSQLIGMADEFSSEDFCSLVFDSFLLRSVTRENVARHTLRLVEYIFQKLPALRLSSLQSQLSPKDEHSQEVGELYKVVMEKIDSHTPEPLPQEQELDSPLMSVPTPAPL
ncbi:Negative elongation factor B [Holothuria leucospilota]|uniref:Negative elongation factor B n=1 Tax=Holothuria leucospilota TaxID=206669 RepID=A0A9Q1C521_HOLLE|nr:Negative elongation factor B [Holothuria leucospilota]